MVRAVQRRLPGVVFLADTDAPLVALTLDDGPDDSVTPAVLDILDRERVRATWFVIGERAARHPEVMRAITAAGHEVGNHAWTDRPTWRLARDEFRQDLLRTHALLGRYESEAPAPPAPPARPRLMRPASGWFRQWAPDELRAHGYRLVLGSAYATDTWRPPPAYLRWALTRMARPGAILVLHVGPGRWRTPAVLADVIRGVRAKGLEFATVGELMTQGESARPGDRRQPPPARAPAPSASPRGRA